MLEGEISVNGAVVGGIIGQRGAPGRDAKINGYNTVTIEGGTNISVTQEDDTLSINTSNLAEVATSGSYTDLSNTPTKVSDFTNDSGFIDKDVNNLTKYTLSTNTGSTIELSINSSTYVVTLNLKNPSGTTISTGTIDLPLESVVVSGSYDAENKKVILTLESGSTIEFSVADLVYGLQSEITNDNKLNADLVDDTNTTNKFTNATEKQTWNDKVGKTDYANSSVGGVFRTGNGAYVQSNGVIANSVLTYENYNSYGTGLFISKGTLENVITGKGLVSNTDYAGEEIAGVIKAYANYGTSVDNGRLRGVTKTYEQYQTSNNLMLVSKITLDNVLNAKIGAIDDVLDAINGEVI